MKNTKRADASALIIFACLYQHSSNKYQQTTVRYSQGPV